jgi:type IV pilus assembly protein PilC
MDHLARLAERSAVLRRRVRSALAYPLFVCLVAVAAIVFLLIVIVPTFAEMYSGFGAELPQATQHLVSISRAMTRGWFVWIGILGFIIAVGARLARSDGFRRSMDQALARLPIVGRLIGQRDAAAFSRAMATMLENGVSVEVALSLASNTASSSVARSEIVRALGHVRSGRSVGDALGEAVSLPDLLRTMVVAGDLSGRLEVVFAKAADHYEHELSAALDTLVSLIEPTIILVLGGILAWVLAALYLPMFDLATIMQ